MALTNRFPFSEGSGTTSAASIGAASATLNGGATWVTDLGGGGYAIATDGVDDYVSFGSTLDTVGSEGSLAWRMNIPQSLSNGVRIMSKFNKTSAQDGSISGLDLSYSSSRFALRSWPGGTTQNTIANIIPAATTFACIITWGPLGRRMYFDDVLVSVDHALTAGWTSGASNPLVFGAKLEATAGNFSAIQVDDVTVADEQWTQEQVSEYVRGLNPTTRVGLGTGSGFVRQASAAFTPETGDENAIQEACVIWSDSLGKFQAWGHTGWSGDNFIRYYESDDGLTFTRGTVDPVLGGGNGGESSVKVGRFHVYIENGTYYGTYDDFTAGTPKETKLVTSSDGITWSNPATIISNSEQHTASNIILGEDGTYYLLSAVDGTFWTTELWGAPAITGPWTVRNGGNKLTSLQAFPGGLYGGYCVKRIGSLYWFFYHANPIKTGNSPTTVHAAYSTDLINWTQYAYGPTVQLEGLTADEDQSTDVWVTEANGKTYRYFGSVSNVNHTGTVYVEVYDGALTDLLGSAETEFLSITAGGNFLVLQV